LTNSQSRLLAAILSLALLLLRAGFHLTAPSQRHHQQAAAGDEVLLINLANAWTSRHHKPQRRKIQLKITVPARISSAVHQGVNYHQMPSRRQHRDVQVYDVGPKSRPYVTPTSSACRPKREHAGVRLFVVNNASTPARRR